MQVQLYDYASRNSFHLFETIAFFDRLSHLIDSPTEADLLFAQRVQQMVADFVHAPLDSLLQPQPAEQHRQPDRAVHPHPKLGEDGLWPRYPNAIALLDRELTLVNSYASGRCAFWTQQALDRYAWIC